MSRIGKLPIALPDNVKLTIGADNVIMAEGAKGKNAVQVNPTIEVVQEEGMIHVRRRDDSKEQKALHGLYRALVQNLVTGVSEGFVKELEIIGVGFRASMNGDVLELALGYSHPIFFMAPEGITLEVDTKRGKNTIVTVRGNDRELVGQVAAKIRALRKPEPYKGKGIRYLGEKIRRKAGKSAGK